MTDTTAPRTAAPDLAAIRELAVAAEADHAKVELPWSQTHTPRLPKHRNDCEHLIAALDPATVLVLLDRAEAIEPLLALVRAAEELVRYEEQHPISGGWAARVGGLAFKIDALPESVRIAARKP